MKQEFNFSKIEKKWQKKWEEKKVFRVKEDKKKKKYYVLEMYPYPSASYLHMGHVRNYTIGDVYARFKRMNGFNVLYPMGFDSFGMPAETAAKKEGIHPRKYTENSIKKITEYMKALGNSYDWSKTLASHEPEYYKWNQYFFLKLFEKGLAYRKKAPVNWCPTCESVLANEEAEKGKCWRCGGEVIQKEMEQWFLRITSYADQLLRDLSKIEWHEKIKKMQTDWIGKSYGTKIYFEIDGKKIPIFTTRPDTIFGVTFLVISSQHSELMNIVTKEQKKEVEKFLKKIKSSKTEDMEKLSKEGVFTGSYAKNPMNNELVPVWIGNFVVADYGSGVVMAVPSHDQRDFEFAKKYNLKIKPVIQYIKEDVKEIIKTKAYEGSGILINSGDFNGLSNDEAKVHITKYLEEKKLGGYTIQYKLRDWMISRQRYWGTPIPIIYCDECGSKVHFDNYKSYLMGGSKITGNDLIKIGVKIVDTTQSGSRKLLIPNNKIERYLQLIAKRLDKGFWNEVVGNEVIFLFKFKDGKTEKFVLNDKNSEKIAALCAEFNNKPYEKTSDLLGYLLDNDFYNDYVAKIKNKGKPAIIPVPEKDLPVLLPEKVDFKTNANPLSTNKSFVNVKCPKCGGKGRRETDTMGGFVDSSWYFLRYCDNKNKKKAFDEKKVNYWMPVDQYIGGAEHAVMHLMYARFFVKALKDLGFLKFDEPFMKLFNQGIVYKDGAKMSKSKGNVVFQTDISDKYGIDTARLFLMFVSSPDKQMEWNDEGVEGSFRIINKLIRLKDNLQKKPDAREDSKINFVIKRVTESIDTFEYPKSVVSMIEFLDYAAANGIAKNNYESLLKLFSPFCPHITEELWEKIGNKGFISLAKWPVADEKKINNKFEEQEKQVEKIIEDINNILKIVGAKKKVSIYTIPNDKETYSNSLDLIEKRTNLVVQIFAVNDKNKYDPTNKSKNSKPGKPALYLE
ncbi:MAG: leucine--tRNA ligase [Nanoarchaeota archaeon]|nr:leucine--tRNA ligase [Nanoarchaeota archaeon]